MIRVNLLPDRRSAQRRSAAEGGNGWLGVVLGVLVLEVILLLLVQKSKQDDLTRVQRHNTEIQSNIDDIKRQIANREEIRAQLKELREREEAIQKLQSARTGPTAVMLELSHVLTPGRLPTMEPDRLEQLRRDNPTSVPNPGWDPRRLWLTSYDELDRTVRMSGLARDGEDVSELLRRLALSEYFLEVKMLPAGKVMDDKTHLELVKFDLSAKVRY